MTTISQTLGVILETILGLAGLVFIGWVFVRSLKRSEDPPKLIFKWVLTAAVVAIMIFKVAPIVGAGGYGGAFGGIPMTAVCGLFLAIIWRHSIASIIASPFASLYDGGTAEIEPRPYYSAADAKRKKGQYAEAAAEVRKQLDKFPNDVEGQMKLAEIQAENLNDLAGAEITIQRLCNQPGHTPRNISFALNTLADWHLKYGLDRDAARLDLQKLADLYPESDFAMLAAQRIAHLAQTDVLVSPHDRRRFQLSEGVQNIGLLKSSAHLQPVGTDPGEIAAQYVRHLEEHPQDGEAREKLAVIYAGHYGRLDLAADQLEQLINHPNQPGKQVVHWLNMLADLQVQGGAGYEKARATLEQIIERYPNVAAAELARNRIDLLRLELKSREERPGIKMGDYEQNIGLKPRSPREF